MFWSRTLPLAQLIDLCRRLRYNMAAGITVAEAFRLQSVRGSEPLRSIASRIHLRLLRGDSLRAALKAETAFPPLFLNLTAVGENSGQLVEIFAALERYYALQQQLLRKFRAQIILPVAQFILAVLLISLLIWILGVLSSTRGSTISGLFGLSGAGGAGIFLGLVFGTIALLFFTVQLLSRRLRGQSQFHALLLRLPGLGPSLEAIALSRFTLALQMTLDAGMSITRAVRLSLQATGNPIYAAQAESAEVALRAGADLTLALSRTRLFSKDFQHILSVAEESGSVPEVMEQQHHYYQEEAERRLKVLAQMAGGAVWLLYAIFMVIMIFRMASVYFGALGI